MKTWNYAKLFFQTIKVLTANKDPDKGKSLVFQNSIFKVFADEFEPFYHILSV